MLKRKENGQSYIEFALVLPFLVLLVLGALDLGRGLNAHIVVTNAAREGARYGATHSSDIAGIKARAIQETTGTGVTISEADIAVSYPAGDQNPGSPLRVTVTHNFQLIVLWIFTSQTIPIRAESEMEIIQ